MRRFLAIAFFACAAAARADEVVLDPQKFLEQTFDGRPPSASEFWLDNAAQAQLKPIFGHNYPAARVKYWKTADRVVWILEDIGKEFPITAGFVVKDGAIDAARLLIYRETRGDEIRNPGFLRQFSGERLKDGELSESVDGISGATLSVSAMKRMARAALVLTGDLR
ncbi:MAG TPA: FMN-binding protein [Nevskiaceae bacterium]|nr:FMN-binding protein [Nevskiaceae bacterium]